MPRRTPNALLLALAAAAPGLGKAPRDPRPPADWQLVARPDDKARLHLWHEAWNEGLREARAAGFAGQIAAAGPLFDPDRFQPDPAPPAGAYRCRTYRLGALAAGDRAFAVDPPQPCRVGDGGLTVLAGLQRPTGRLLAYDPDRLVFVGTLALGDEPRALPYGRDAVRDMIGFVERIDDARWRLVLPRPRWQSRIEVVDIVPDAR